VEEAELLLKRGAEFYEAIVKIRCSADNGLPDE
jgi:hypothetical protein